LDDEAEALLGVEKLDSALSHIGLLETRKASVGRTTIVRADIGICVFLGKARGQSQGRQSRMSFM